MVGGRATGFHSVYRSGMAKNPLSTECVPMFEDLSKSEYWPFHVRKRLGSDVCIFFKYCYPVYGSLTGQPCLRYTRIVAIADRVLTITTQFYYVSASVGRKTFVIPNHGFPAILAQYCENIHEGHWLSNSPNPQHSCLFIKYKHPNRCCKAHLTSGGKKFAWTVRIPQVCETVMIFLSW